MRRINQKIMFSGSSFNGSKLKSQLRMASSQIQITSNRKAALLKQSMQEIAMLLKEDPPKYEKARLKTEAFIRDDNLAQALDILQLQCNLLVDRVKLIDYNGKTCPPELKSCIATLIYATPYIDSVKELSLIQKQFRAKYGKHFEEAALKNSEKVVNEKIAALLTMQPPPPFLVQKYMVGICEQYEINWKPTVVVGPPPTPPPPSNPSASLSPAVVYDLNGSNNKENTKDDKMNNKYDYYTVQAKDVVVVATPEYHQQKQQDYPVERKLASAAPQYPASTAPLAESVVEAEAFLIEEEKKSSVVANAMPDQPSKEQLYKTIDMKNNITAAAAKSKLDKMQEQLNKLDFDLPPPPTAPLGNKPDSSFTLPPPAPKSSYPKRQSGVDSTCEKSSNTPSTICGGQQQNQDHNNAQDIKALTDGKRVDIHDVSDEEATVLIKRKGSEHFDKVQAHVDDHKSNEESTSTRGKECLVNDAENISGLVVKSGQNPATEEIDMQSKDVALEDKLQRLQVSNTSKATDEQPADSLTKQAQMNTCHSTGDNIYASREELLEGSNTKNQLKNDQPTDESMSIAAETDSIEELREKEAIISQVVHVCDTPSEQRVEEGKEDIPSSKLTTVIDHKLIVGTETAGEEKEEIFSPPVYHAVISADYPKVSVQQPSSSQMESIETSEANDVSNMDINAPKTCDAPNPTSTFNFHPQFSSKKTKEERKKQRTMLAAAAGVVGGVAGMVVPGVAVSVVTGVGSAMIAKKISKSIHKKGLQHQQTQHQEAHASDGLSG